MSERESFRRVGRSRTDDCGVVVCVRILDLLVDSSISVERSCEVIDQQT